MGNKTKSRKLKVLLVGGLDFNKTKLLNILSKNDNFEVTLCSYVVSNSLISDLGNLRFSDDSSTWKFTIKDSINELVYKYGIDPMFAENDDFANYFAVILRDYLRRLGYKFTNDTEISEIFNTVNSLVVFEDNLSEFDLIIVDTLVDRIQIFQKIEPEMVIEYVDDPINPLPYVLYKISPDIIKIFLKANKKIIFLMDYDSSQSLNEYFTNGIERLSKNLLNVGISVFANGQSLQNGLEIKIHSKEILISKEFIINIDDYFLDNISKDYSHFFDNIKTLKVDTTIHLSPYNKDGIEDKSKILISSNKNSSYLFTEDDSREFAVNFSKLVYGAFNQPGIFGVLDIEPRNQYCMLTGNIFCDRYLSDKNLDNKIFLENVLECLSDTNECVEIAKSGRIPHVVMNVNEKKAVLTIRDIEIDLDFMSFCVYRCFLEAAKNGEVAIPIGEEIKLKKYNFEDVNSVSKKLMEQIYKHYEETFPDKIPQKLLNYIKGASKKPYKIGTMEANISKINDKIEEKLPRLNMKFLNKIKITPQADKHYWITIPSEFIQIISE